MRSLFGTGEFLDQEQIVRTMRLGPALATPSATAREARQADANPRCSMQVSCFDWAIGRRKAAANSRNLMRHLMLRWQRIVVCRCGVHALAESLFHPHRPQQVRQCLSVEQEWSMTSVPLS